MANTQFDSALAKKLNTFVPLSPDELKCLAEMQRQPPQGEARQAAHA